MRIQSHSRQDHYYRLHFTDEKAEAQTTQMPCPVTPLTCGGARTEARPAKPQSLPPDPQFPCATGQLHALISEASDPPVHQVAGTTPHCLLPRDLHLPFSYPYLLPQGFLVEELQPRLETLGWLAQAQIFQAAWLQCGCAGLPKCCLLINP